MQEIEKRIEETAQTILDELFFYVAIRDLDSQCHDMISEAVYIAAEKIVSQITTLAKEEEKERIWKWAINGGISHASCLESLQHFLAPDKPKSIREIVDELLSPKT